jgi:hypothetical protein
MSGCSAHPQHHAETVPGMEQGVKVLRPEWESRTEVFVANQKVME